MRDLIAARHESGPGSRRLWRTRSGSWNGRIATRRVAELRHEHMAGCVARRWNDVIEWTHHAWTLQIADTLPRRRLHRGAADSRSRAGAAVDRHRERRVALPRRRRRPHPLVGPRPDQRRQLLRSGGRLDLAGRQLRAQHRLLQPFHADLRGRRRLHRGLAAAAGRGNRSGHRRDAVDLPRAGVGPAPALAPAGLRQGGRLRPRWKAAA